MCLMNAYKRAIEVCHPGALLLEIGKAIEDYASSQGCSVVNQFVGHGIGIIFTSRRKSPTITTASTFLWSGNDLYNRAYGQCRSQRSSD